MAFSELELKRIDRTVGDLCRHLSAPEHADKLRIIYEIADGSVSIYEERPPWDGVGDWTRLGVARLRYFSSRREWRLYWMRADRRWHRYGPPELPIDLASLVTIVEADDHGAFFS